MQKIQLCISMHINNEFFLCLFNVLLSFCFEFQQNVSTGRRLSSRAKTKPDYFNASPILPSASKAKNVTNPSPLVSSALHEKSR